jgi:hypothetical protein
MAFEAVTERSWEERYHCFARVTSMEVLCSLCNDPILAILTAEK